MTIEKIHLIDRIFLAGMIPSSGTWAQDKVWKESRDKLEITADEVMRYGIRLSATNIQWFPEIDCDLDEDGEPIEGTGTPMNLMNRTDVPIDWPLSEAATKICKFAAWLKKAERSEEGLPSTHMSLFEMFVGPAPLDLDFLAKQAEEEEAKADAAYEASLEDDEAEEKPKLKKKAGK